MSPLLRQLCGGSFNCTDASALGLRETPEWREMLTTTGFSQGTASLLVEQSIAALAGRGFFATSKFCGPPGYRRSTFSEDIALRWQTQHEGAPLCARGLEHSLLKGMVPHGASVY